VDKTETSNRPIKRAEMRTFSA